MALYYKINLSFQRAKYPSHTVCAQTIPSHTVCAQKNFSWEKPQPTISKACEKSRKIKKISY
jgi:hypothetical protein